MSVQEGALDLGSERATQGVSVQRIGKSKGILQVRIEWGILKYPEGASYEQHSRNEALMVYISFGPRENLPVAFLFYQMSLIL